MHHVLMARQSTLTARAEMHLHEKHINCLGFTVRYSLVKESSMCHSMKKQIGLIGYVRTQAAFIQLNNINTDQ